MLSGWTDFAPLQLHLKIGPVSRQITIHPQHRWTTAALENAAHISDPSRALAWSEFKAEHLQQFYRVVQSMFEFGAAKVQACSELFRHKFYKGSKMLLDLPRAIQQQPKPSTATGTTTWGYLCKNHPDPLQLTFTPHHFCIDGRNGNDPLSGRQTGAHRAAPRFTGAGILKYTMLIDIGPAAGSNSDIWKTATKARAKTESVTRVSRPKHPSQEPHRTKSVTAEHQERMQGNHEREREGQQQRVGHPSEAWRMIKEPGEKQKVSNKESVTPGRTKQTLKQTLNNSTLNKT